MGGQVISALKSKISREPKLSRNRYLFFAILISRKYSALGGKRDNYGILCWFSDLHIALYQGGLHINCEGSLYA